MNRTLQFVSSKHKNHHSKRPLIATASSPRSVLLYWNFICSSSSARYFPSFDTGESIFIKNSWYWLNFLFISSPFLSFCKTNICWNWISILYSSARCPFSSRIASWLDLFCMLSWKNYYRQQKTVDYTSRPHMSMQSCSECSPFCVVCTWPISSSCCFLFTMVLRLSCSSAYGECFARLLRRIPFTAEFM